MILCVHQVPGYTSWLLCLLASPKAEGGCVFVYGSGLEDTTRAKAYPESLASGRRESRRRPRGFHEAGELLFSSSDYLLVLRFLLRRWCRCSGKGHGIRQAASFASPSETCLAVSAPVSPYFCFSSLTLSLTRSRSRRLRCKLDEPRGLTGSSEVSHPMRRFLQLARQP